MKYVMLALICGAVMAAPARAAGELTIEEFLQKLSTVPDVVNRKDPFVVPSPPYSSDVSNKENTSVLELYPLSQYAVVATLIGDQYPRALIKVPGETGTNRILIVREKDRLGQSGGVITRIQKDGIYVTQEQRSNQGTLEKVEILMKIEASKK